MMPSYFLSFTKWLADYYRCELELLFPPTLSPDIRGWKYLKTFSLFIHRLSSGPDQVFTSLQLVGISFRFAIILIDDRLKIFSIKFLTWKMLKYCRVIRSSSLAKKMTSMTALSIANIPASIWTPESDRLFTACPFVPTLSPAYPITLPVFNFIGQHWSSSDFSALPSSINLDLQRVNISEE